MSILGLHTEIAQYSCKLCTRETGCYSSMLADKQPCFSVSTQGHYCSSGLVPFDVSEAQNFSPHHATVNSATGS